MVLLALAELLAEMPMPPTMRELAVKLDRPPDTNNKIRDYVRRLVRDGYVMRIPRLTRATFLTRRGRARVRELRQAAA